MRIPFYNQSKDYYCGPASMQMVLGYFGKHITQEKLARELKTQQDDGTDHHDLIRVATENGFYCYVNQSSTLQEIRYFLSRNLPVIVNFMEPTDDDAHYAVVVGSSGRKLVLNDPWNGKKFKLPEKWFMQHWYDVENRAKQWIMVLSTEDLCLGKQFFPK